MGIVFLSCVQDLGQHKVYSVSAIQNRVLLNTALNHRPHFTTNMVHEIHGFYNKMHYSKYTGLLELLNGFLKVQLKHQFKDNALKRWDANLRDISLSLETVGLELLISKRHLFPLRKQSVIEL